MMSVKPETGADDMSRFRMVGTFSQKVTGAWCEMSLNTEIMHSKIALARERPIVLEVAAEAICRCMTKAVRWRYTTPVGLPPNLALDSTFILCIVILMKVTRRIIPELLSSIALYIYSSR
jgi:hypothetical protein